MSEKRVRELLKSQGKPFPQSAQKPLRDTRKPQMESEGPINRLEHNHGEEAFLFYWKLLTKGRREPVRQHNFRPNRAWRLDFAWIEQKVCVEISGGCHTVLDRLLGDYERQNALVEDGWRFLTFHPRQLDDDPNFVIGQVLRVLEAAK